jgi:ACS family sodium-dependent inorganic phosphate cotransporter/ACS family sodium-dependent inorganic phosphate cotransporter-like MFS transporter 9
MCPDLVLHLQVMSVGSMTAGVMADGLIQTGMPVTRVRKFMQTIAFIIPAAALIVLAKPGISSSWALACLTVALGTTSLGQWRDSSFPWRLFMLPLLLLAALRCRPALPAGQAGFVANMTDIAPRKAGQMFGLCNTFGSLSGIIGVSGVGFIVERTGSFDAVFKITAALYLFGTLFWNVFCTGEVVFE